MKLTLMIAIAFFVIGCGASAAPTVQNEVPSETQPTKAEPAGDSHSADDGHNHGEEDKAERISLADAKKAFDAGEAVFVDTRGRSSYDNERIKGAVSVPAAEFATAYKDIPKDKKIITYCS